MSHTLTKFVPLNIDNHKCTLLYARWQYAAADKIILNDNRATTFT